jgi:amino acid adenylation domain-containing protein
VTEPLHNLLTGAARLAPDHPAAVDGDRMLTYRQLDQQANRLAHRLIDCGVRPGDRVGLLLEKSLATLVAVYGTLKAGAAYVPLAPKQPPERQAHIIGVAGVQVVVTAGEPCLSPDIRLVDLSACDELANEPDTAPSIPVGVDDLAYVLFTSGSTGRPKGVALTHRNAMSFVDWAVSEFGIVRADRLANHAPLNFDLTVFDLYAAARAAATVVLVPRPAAAFPRELADFVRRQRISVWYSVPSALHMLVRRGGLEQAELPHLRLVLFAGEVFPVPQLRALMTLLPHAEYANLYGPTETNVCTFHRVPNPLPESCLALPIGMPVDGVAITAHAKDGSLVPDGEQGELWVRGPTVMRGYIGEPELTAAALCTVPPAGPAYRTGDLGHRDALGVWWFAGRVDSQIKSRGYRIEPGEIEAALHSHPAVVECAVVPVADEEFGSRIRAHVVVRDGLGAAELLAHSRKTLPGYMVPGSFELRDSLPRTSTGKIDYQRLK